MKKIFFLPVLLMIALILSGQNVGIGTNNPTEKLDVNGNLNINGNLKINGTSGQSGQMLMTNDGGQTIWADAGSEYKNLVRYSQNGIWVVPVGITNIKVEAWGGGGGGATGGGGGSGTYFCLLNYSVTPGSTVTVTVGDWGVGAATNVANGGDGGTTTATFSQNGYIYSAFGGKGAKLNEPGQGTTIAASLPVNNVIYIGGNNGEATSESYYQLNATDFVTATKYGNGGNAVLLNSGGGQGGFSSINTTVSFYIKNLMSTRGSGPGAGGGGGYTPNGEFGSFGARGLVLIWY